MKASVQFDADNVVDPSKNAMVEIFSDEQIEIAAKAIVSGPQFTHGSVPHRCR